MTSLSMFAPCLLDLAPPVSPAVWHRFKLLLLGLWGSRFEDELATGSRHSRRCTAPKSWLRVVGEDAADVMVFRDRPRREAVPTTSGCARCFENERVAATLGVPTLTGRQTLSCSIAGAFHRLLGS